MSDEELIAEASRGNLGPLLDAVRTRKPPMGVVSDFPGTIVGDFNIPSDDLWTHIEVAVMEGELTEKQYDELYDALNGPGKGDPDA